MAESVGGTRARHPLLVTGWLVLMLAGGWSLTRFEPATAALGPLAEVRVWLAVLLVGAVAVGLALHRDAPRAPAPDARSFTWIVSALWTYLLCSTAWTPDLALAAPRVFDLALLIGLAWLTFTIFRATPEAAIDLVLRLGYGMALLYALGGLLAGGVTDQGRMVVLGGGPNVFARVMGLGCLAALYLWTTRGRGVWLFGVPLFLYGAVMSGSRGGLVALLASAPLLFLVLARRGGVRWRALWPAGLATVALLALKGQALAQFWAQRFLEQTFEHGYLSDRDYLFGQAWRLFTGHPITGVGLEGFTALVHEVYPHNHLLHLAAEGGLIALFLFAVALSVLAARLVVGPPLALPQLTCLAAAWLYFVAGCFSGAFYDARFLYAFALLALLPSDPPCPPSRPSSPPCPGLRPPHSMPGR